MKVRRGGCAVVEGVLRPIGAKSIRLHVLEGSSDAHFFPKHFPQIDLQQPVYADWGKPCSYD